MPLRRRTALGPLQSLLARVFLAAVRTRGGRLRRGPARPRRARQAPGRSVPPPRPGSAGTGRCAPIHLSVSRAALTNTRVEPEAAKTSDRIRSMEEGG